MSPFKNKTGLKNDWIEVNLVLLVAVTKVIGECERMVNRV